ncbi:methionine adenosyltransferase [Myxococcota bacterium]|nr:methionine adenosyltransferase [Myxococcota bacterium]
MKLHLGRRAVGPQGDALRGVEIVERKGVGHPDTITDCLAEALSARLSREYLHRFGRVLHHNVDKALLFGGEARPALGGGRLLAPMELYLAGRATVQVGGERIDVQGLAREVVEQWVRAHLRFVDPATDLRVHVLVRPGSVELAELFADPAQARCNDTSYGVGSWPRSHLEAVVWEVERRLNAPETKARLPALGEDVKVMGTRVGEQLDLTVAVAMVDRFLPDLAAWRQARADATALVQQVAGPHARVVVNAADAPEQGRLYLTVTGTSAEAGDDGQVGRGNRINGLITPMRAMSLEAAAGKNPVTHVGKLYNLVAEQAARAICQALPEVAAAEVALVSRIGAPVREPALVQVTLQTREDQPVEPLRNVVSAAIQASLDAIPALTGALIGGHRPVC